MSKITNINQLNLGDKVKVTVNGKHSVEAWVTPASLAHPGLPEDVWVLSSPYIPTLPLTPLVFLLEQPEGEDTITVEKIADAGDGIPTEPGEYAEVNGQWLMREYDEGNQEDRADILESQGVTVEQFEFLRETPFTLTEDGEWMDAFGNVTETYLLSVLDLKFVPWAERESIFDNHPNPFA